MVNKKQTSQKVASLASKLLKKDLPRKQEKSVAGSDLAQTKSRKKSKKK